MFEPWNMFDWGNVPLLMVIGTVISLAITVIVYFISLILKHTKWEAFAKKEIGQAFMNILLFWLIFFSLGILLGPDGLIENSVIMFFPEADAANTLLYNNISDGWTHGAVWNSVNHTCLITKEYAGDTGKKYVYYPVHVCLALRNLHDIAGLAGDSLSYVFYQGSLYKVFRESYIQLGTYQYGWKSYPGAGFTILIAQMQELFDILMTGYVIVILQYFALDLISQVIFPLFLVLGMVLRNFYITRRLGGFIAALALALFLIGPLFYMINYHFFYYPDHPKYLTTNDEGKVFYNDLTNLDSYKSALQIFGRFDNTIQSVNDTGDETVFEWLWDKITTVIGFVVNLFWFVVLLTFKFYYDVMRYVVLRTFIDAAMFKGIGAFMVNYGGWEHMAARLSMYIIVTPILSLYAVVASIKYFSYILGGESKIVGLSHFL